MITSELAKTKQLLLDLGAWQVCSFEDVDQYTVMGVHTRCIIHKDGVDDFNNIGVYNWGWTLSDTVPDCAEKCFNCKAAVPPEVVAIIKMLKFNNTE